MRSINSPIPARPAAERSCSPWAAALVATPMLFFGPAASADALICEISRDGSPQRYLIDIDDQRSSVTVVDADDTRRSYPVTVGELTPERVVFAFNGMRMDPGKFVRGGKVVTMSVTTHTEALVDRATSTFLEIGYVTDDRDEVLSLDTLKAMQAEEEAWAQKRKSGPSHNPMFWLLLEVATYRADGLCRVAERRPVD